MNQPIVQAALTEIWSAPDTTNQFICQLPRVTPNGGVLISQQFNWDVIALPDRTTRWHLYMIGQISPTLINLFSVQGQWELLSDACNRMRMVANIYTGLGLEIPRTRTYYLVTRNNNILIAVEKNLRLDYNFDTDTLHLRTYRNPYYQRTDIPFSQFHVGGGKMTTTADILALNSEMAAIRADQHYLGGLYCFVNGVKVTDVNVGTAKIGDIAEYVYDSSIYKVIDFQLSTLPTFISTLDAGKHKYLLHYPANVGWDGKIDFQANIDIYIVDVSTQRGFFVNKNAEDTMRMVTFKDYAVVTSYLSAYFDNFLDAQDNLSINNIYLRLHVRYDGFDQAPVQDANRLHYLLKLSDVQQVAALTGVDSSLSTWNAANLEASAYTALMTARHQQVTLPLSEAAFGYSVVNKKFAANVQATQLVGASRQAPVPLGFQLGATAFEYDTNGLLIGTYPVPPTIAMYPCVNAGAALVEYVSGTGGLTLDEMLGEVTTPMTPGYNYRAYMREVVDGALNPNYTDVTGNATYYAVVNNQLNWVITGNKYRIVRSDKKFLTYSVVLNPTDGVLAHTLTYTQAGTQVVLPVPMGELDVWLNGHSLVPGVDYFFTFPTITVVSKTYLKSPVPGPQTLTVRYTGFCKQNLSAQKVEETGFVWDGVLSIDKTYALHFYKSQRIVVDGKLLLPDSAPFIEDTLSGSLRNGAPYAVREYINPLNTLIDQEPYTYYGVDVATDGAVSDYLQLKLGALANAPLNPVVNQVELYSPFLCKIIYALNAGSITSPTLAGPYSDSFVQQLCAPYEYLLDGDPLKMANTPDLRYCLIAPHWLATPLSLSRDNYRFFTNVVRIYARNLVDFAETVNVLP